MQASMPGSCGSPSLQCEIESSALFRRALRPNAAAVTFDDALHRGQADPGAFEFGAGMQALERMKELLQVGRIEPGAIVFQEISVRACIRSGAKLDASGFFPARELPGVLKKIHENNPQQSSVADRLDLRRDDELGPPIGIARCQLGGD